MVQFDIENSIYRISRKQYELAQKRYKLPIGFDEHLAILVARYIAIGTTNNHASVPPKVIEFCSVNTEMFGSPLNTSAEQYCSPMFDIEKEFGSIGSFFNIELTPDTYLCNPPYDEVIINQAMRKILSAFDRNVEMTVIIVLPAWDIETQLLINQTETLAGGTKTVKPVKYVEFPIISEIKRSRFLRSNVLLNYEDHRFYNFYTDEHVALTDTHLFVMSNTMYNLTAMEIADFWRRIFS
ncbi:MAG: hypothetical protein JRZ94_04690 [Nitrososphaerota archaeon]|nr:hypothetical protein [Nitrososphaerota archaeon]